MGRVHRYIGRPRGSRDLRGRCVRVELGRLVVQTRARVGGAIRRARIDASIAAAELAAACAVSVRLVHEWEAGDVGLSVARLRQVSIALGVPIEHLLAF